LRRDRTDTADYGPTGPPRQTRTTYAYDAFGNTTRVTALGEVLLDGGGTATDVNFDKSESAFEYLADVTNWRLSLPTREELSGYNSALTWGSQSDRRLVYDGQGNLASVKLWNGSTLVTVE